MLNILVFVAFAFTIPFISVSLIKVVEELKKVNENLQILSSLLLQKKNEDE